MISFPNARINLGLHVTGKRSDGYHEIETLMLPVSMHDALEFIISPDGGTRLTTSGHHLPDDGQPNLCLQAYRYLDDALRKRQFAEARKMPEGLPPLHIHLHKGIPPGSGLAGGSADATFMLKMLNKAFDLGLSAEQLAKLAAKLGSDCPFFIYNKPMLATGRGNILNITPAANLKKLNIIIVVPPIHISTEKAYQKLSPKAPSHTFAEILQSPIDQCLDKLVNDFEKVIFEEYPQIEAVKTGLKTSGAVYASLSGSGSAVYGLYIGTPPIKKIKQQFADCIVRASRFLYN